MTNGLFSGGGSGRRRSGLVLAAVLFVVQLAAWRGTQRLRAVSIDPIGVQHLVKRTTWPMSVVDDGHAQGHKKKSHKHTDHKDKNKKHHSSTSSHSTLTATSSSSSSTSSADPTSTWPGRPTCRPLPADVTPEELCLHIRANCPPTGHLDYLQFFYCIGLDVPTKTLDGRALPTSAPEWRASSNDNDDSTSVARQKKHQDLTSNVELLRILALVLIVLWMLFLFSWVGIVASDFFCPNLSTLAARLGLSESTAGVTFLAFGNGSPDVFSTFGAMRTGSGSLAIGELIGAASFIVSVISGSMMLIAPFRVKPFPFLRDVGFFTVAVSMTLVFLFDGNLRFGECVSLIALYLVYAATIIIGSWWQERRRLQKLRLASIRNESSTASEAHDQQSDTEGQHVHARTSPYFGPMSAIEYDPDVDPFSNWIESSQNDIAESGHLTPRSADSNAPSPSLHPTDLPTGSTSNNSVARLQRFRNGMLARHSLLGAVEFRDVVQNLQREASADRTMEIYQSRDPERYLPHPHQHHQHLSSHVGAAADDSSARRHSRTKSLHRPRTQRFSSQSSADIRRSLIRSRSTIGASAESGPLVDVERPTLEQVGGQSSGLAAAAAALGDPWREHGPDDGCETTQLPPAALPLSDDDDGNRSDQARRPRSTLPRLVVRQATNPLDANGTASLHKRTNDVERSTSWRETRSAAPAASKQAWRSLMHALFPSLRHFREKSWLGIAVGLITAPAILLLNLTLPVVDDEAERAMVSGEKQTGYSNASNAGSGRIRLEGSEAPLHAFGGRVDARTDVDEDFSAHDGEEDAAFGRGVIDLGGKTTPENPWDASTDSVGGPADNRRGNLEVATALRRLPEDASPLLSGASRSKGPVVHADGADSVYSDESCESDDSHIVTETSRLALGIAQCIFAPPFCVWAITSSARSKHVLAKTLAGLFGGMALAAFVILIGLPAQRFGHPNTSIRISTAVGWLRVGMGFFVSILYIMTIVDEVVSILQTLGLVLGLSDAILGLTVFAMGNSLGDLVANITIAKMGHPVMAISACFAGPLLNLLLGIGISGTWLLSGRHTPNTGSSHATFVDNPMQNPGVYHIDFSPTLTVSGCGLLLILVGTLICVPLNGFRLNGKIGTTLIITYIIIMCVNIGVEIYNLQP